MPSFFASVYNAGLSFVHECKKLMQCGWPMNAIAVTILCFVVLILSFLLTCGSCFFSRNREIIINASILTIYTGLTLSLYLSACFCEVLNYCENCINLLLVCIPIYAMLLVVYPTLLRICCCQHFLGKGNCCRHILSFLVQISLFGVAVLLVTMNDEEAKTEPILLLLYLLVFTLSTTSVWITSSINWKADSRSGYQRQIRREDASKPLLDDDDQSGYEYDLVVEPPDVAETTAEIEGEEILEMEVTHDEHCDEAESEGNDGEEWTDHNSAS